MFFEEGRRSKVYLRAKKFIERDEKSINLELRPCTDIYSLLFASSFTKFTIDSISWITKVQTSEEKQRKDLLEKFLKKE